MWPVEGSSSAPSGGSAKLDRRARAALAAGGAALLAAVVIGCVAAIRAGGPAAPAGSVAGGAPAALWAADGAGFRPLPAGAPGPVSNHADMAFDRARGVLVVWDHGCARLVMGFQGGCVEPVDRTWTWDGRAWTAHPAGAGPEAGAVVGAMAYDARLGEVVYASGAGHAWAWAGAGWRRLAVAVPAALAGGGSIAAGFDAGQDRFVVVTAASTWAWAGASSWTRLGPGIDAADARADGTQLAADPGRGQLVYAGRSRTWTWAGGGWQSHAEPAFGSAAVAFDPALGSVLLISEDAQACDRSACRSAAWAWNGAVWVREAGPGPDLPLGRSAAFPPAITYDAVAGRLDVLVSAA